MAEASTGIALIVAVLAVGATFGIIGWVLPVSEGWNDLNFEGNQLAAGASAPDMVDLLGSGGLRGRAFDGSATSEQLYGGTELLHGYKEGTAIYPHVHWMPTTADVGNVTWFFEYSWANHDAVYSEPVVLSVTSLADGAWNHTRADFPAINGEGYTIGSHIVFRLYRDPTAATDTYEHDAALLSVGIHYATDGVGSAEISTK